MKKQNVQKVTLLDRIHAYVVAYSYAALYLVGYIYMAVLILAVSIIALDVFLILGGCPAGPDSREVFFLCWDLIRVTFKVAASVVGIFGGTFGLGYAIAGVALLLRNTRNRRYRKVAKFIAGIAVVLAWPTLTVLDYFKDAQYYWGTLNLMEVWVEARY